MDQIREDVKKAEQVLIDVLNAIPDPVVRRDNAVSVGFNLIKQAAANNMELKGLLFSLMERTDNILTSYQSA